MVMDQSSFINNNNNSVKDVMSSESSSIACSPQPSPTSVGREFVRQYYTLLNRAPLHLHRFYSHNSSFVHGGIDDGNGEPVKGQHAIHQQIMQLNFRDCHAKILQVDSHATLGEGVVVQVSGELSNNGHPMRRFMQTFVLAPQGSKKYFVLNDIFRYQDEVFGEGNQVNGGVSGLTVCSSSSSTTPNGKTDEESQEEEEEEHVQDTPTVSIAKINREQEQQELSMPTPAEPAPEVVSAPAPVVVSVAEVKSESKPEEQDKSETKTTIVEEAKKEENKNVEKAPLQATPSNETLSYASALVKANPTGKPPMSGGPPGTATMPPGKEGGPFGNNKARGGGAQGAKRAGQRDRYGSTSARDEEGQDRRRSGVPPISANSNSSAVTASHNGGADRQAERANNSAAAAPAPDSFQVFVGNLPHNCTEQELERLFSQFGKVIDIRISNKGHLQSKTTPGGTRVPNFGFVVFDQESSVQACLKKKPIHLPVNEFRQAEHRLNVEEKKNKASGGSGSGSMGNRNYGSQEHLVGGQQQQGRTGGGQGQAGNERSRGSRGGGRSQGQGQGQGQGKGQGSYRKKSPFPANN